MHCLVSCCVLDVLCGGDAELGFMPVTSPLPCCTVLHCLALRQVVKLGQASEFALPCVMCRLPWCTVSHCLTLRQVVKLGQASEFARQQVEEAGHEDSSARGLLQDYGANPTMATLRTPRTPATHDAILQVMLCCQCDFFSLSTLHACTQTHTHMMPYLMLCVTPRQHTHTHICTQCHI